MALFIADRIIKGQYDYATVMRLPLFAQYKKEVDEILIAEGREDLIVK